MGDPDQVVAEVEAGGVDRDRGVRADGGARGKRRPATGPQARGRRGGRGGGGRGRFTRGGRFGEPGGAVDGRAEAGRGRLDLDRARNHAGSGVECQAEPGLGEAVFEIMLGAPCRVGVAVDDVRGLARVFGSRAERVVGGGGRLGQGYGMGARPCVDPGGDAGAALGVVCRRDQRERDDRGEQRQRVGPANGVADAPGQQASGRRGQCAQHGRDLARRLAGAARLDRERLLAVIEG